MLPINYNDPYIKPNGDVVPIGDVIGGGGGGSELPPHTVADAGKVLTVTDENTLAWGEITGGGGFIDVSKSVPLVYNNPTIEGVTI